MLKPGQELPDVPMSTAEARKERRLFEKDSDIARQHHDAIVKGELATEEEDSTSSKTPTERAQFSQCSEESATTPNLQSEDEAGTPPRSDCQRRNPACHPDGCEMLERSSPEPSTLSGNLQEEESVPSQSDLSVTFVNYL